MCAIPFRMPGCQVQGFVFLLYQGGVGLRIVGADEALPDAHPFPAPVEVAEIDRAVERPRNGMIAHLPFLHGLARAFGGNRDLEAFILVEHLGNLVGYRRAFAAVHRHATHTFEQEIEGEEEPVFLHQETSRHPDRGVEEFAHDKIPVACMGGDADDAFRQLEALARSGLPSEPFQDSLA